jgi:hypothetical protein
LKPAKTVDNVLGEACARGSFSFESIAFELVPGDVSEEDHGQYHKNIQTVLYFLEKKKLIRGENKVELTPNIGLKLKVRYGTVTTLGRGLARQPRLLRVSVIAALVAWKKVVSVLSAFAMIKILHSAYLGAVIALGWMEYICVAILVALLYFLIRRALGKD